MEFKRKESQWCQQYKDITKVITRNNAENIEDKNNQKDIVDYIADMDRLLLSYLNKDKLMESFVECVRRNWKKLIDMKIDNKSLILQIMDDLDLISQQVISTQIGINIYIFEDANGGGISILAINVFPQSNGSGVVSVSNVIITNLSESTKTYSLSTSPVSFTMCLVTNVLNLTSVPIDFINSFQALYFSILVSASPTSSISSDYGDNIVSGSPTSSSSSDYGDNTDKIQAVVLFSVSSFTTPSYITIAGTLSNGSIQAPIEHFIIK